MVERATLIYKMLRLNDPDFTTGAFGVRDCWGRVRKKLSSGCNVIGIGGTSREGVRNGINGRLVWIGIKPRIVGQAARAPVYAFDDHFFVPTGKIDIRSDFPTLAGIMYGTSSYVRTPFEHVPGGDSALDEEVGRLLKLAENAPASKWGTCRRQT
jgi:hypothetical protein